ncbi:MAG: CHASE2 domain-containing protein [Deltaproteobacteria bacterium]|nr:CHASE2 domain-containing protein [Deltaproteobacteria bacterium]
MKFTNKGKGITVGILAALLVIVLTHLGLFSNVLQRLEHWALDYRFHLASNSVDTSDIVIIGIDDESIQKLGTWPWPRSYHAKLIDILARAKAEVVGLDIIFSTRTSQQDLQLAAAINNAQNVIIVAHPTMPAQISFAGNIMTVDHIQSPLKEMGEGARGVGHIAVVYDTDGVVRRTPAFLRTKDRTLLAFGIEVAVAYSEEKDRSIRLDRDYLQVNAIKIPLDGEGNMLVNYVGGPHRFTEISYSKVIEGEVPLDFFKDKIVLVGVTASGLSDAWITPFIHQGGMSSVELHANVIHTILNKRFFIHLGKWQSGLMVLLLGIMSGFIFYRFPRLSVVFLMSMILFIASGSLYLFLKRRVLLETVSLLSVLCATYIPITVIKIREYKMGMWKRDVEMSAVFKMSEAIKSAGDTIEQRIGAVCRLIKECARTDACYVILNRGDKEVVIDGNGRNISRQLADREIVRGVIETGKPIVTGNEKGAARTRGSMYSPIKSISRIYGVLFIEKEEVFDAEDVQTASIFTDYLAFILERNAMLHKVRESQVQTIHALAKLIEAKYPYIREHLGQVSKLVVKMARFLDVPEGKARVIRYASLLHDIGMIGIPEDILYKSDPLTTEERFHLESHPEAGIEVLRSITFLKMAIPIIMHHHERYDGKGYPDGLAGDEVPLGSQILAVADSFVAMLADRPYRKALKQEDAVSEIKRQSGFQFNPKIVTALLQSLNKEESNGKEDNS